MIVPGLNSYFDYPSVGVDASGRVVVGAYLGGFSVAMSTDGVNFSTAQHIKQLAVRGHRIELSASGYRFQVRVVCPLCSLPSKYTDSCGLA